MLEVCVVGILYVKVINNEDEGYFMGIVSVETVGVGVLFVPVLGEELLELGVCQHAGLGRAMYASLHLNHDTYVVIEYEEGVLSDNFLGGFFLSTFSVEWWKCWRIFGW